jgi:hypothetical protein
MNRRYLAQRCVGCLSRQTQVEAVARDGWISWKFRPTLRSSRVGGRVAARDITFAIDGTRTIPCPYRHKVSVRGERSVIPLGCEKASSGDPWALNNKGVTLRAARLRLGKPARCGLAGRHRSRSSCFSMEQSYDCRYVGPVVTLARARGLTGLDLVSAREISSDQGQIPLKRRYEPATMRHVPFRYRVKVPGSHPRCLAT